MEKMTDFIAQYPETVVMFFAVTLLIIVGLVIALFSNRNRKDQYETDPVAAMTPYVMHIVGLGEATIASSGISTKKKEIENLKGKVMALKSYWRSTGRNFSVDFGPIVQKKLYWLDTE
jgi:hypothetical protein